MTSPVETALHTILAADYGLNEGDHLKLCGFLQKAFDESKLTDKREKNRKVTPLDIKLIIGDDFLTTYTLQSRVTISYIQMHGCPPIPDDDMVIGISEKIGSPVSNHKWKNATPNSIIMRILSMHETMNPITISVIGMTRKVRYADFIRYALKKDILEQKARKKFGPLPEDHEESDGCIWRGDYCYARFCQWIICDLLP